MAALEQVLEDIYASLKDDNRELDTHIVSLKKILAEKNMKEVIVDPAKLAQPNRQGRKMMQSYFQKRGVVVKFPEAK